MTDYGTGKVTDPSPLPVTTGFGWYEYGVLMELPIAILGSSLNSYGRAKTFSMLMVSTPAGPNTGAYLYPVIPVVPPEIPSVTATAVVNTVTVSWIPIGDAVSYEVFRGGVSQGATSASSLVQKNVPDGLHSYTARAQYEMGNWSDLSEPAEVTVDTIPPPVPTLSLSVAAAPSRRVTLSWNTVTDAVLYEAFRDGTSIGTTTNTTMTNTPGADGTYTYTIRAKDAVDNWSAQSAGSIVVIDVVAPAVPSPTVSNAGNVITVSWAAVSDATLYEVFRDGESQGTTTNIYLTQTVSDGTYSYTVSASDAAGNWSAQSTGVPISLDSTPPTVPTVSVSRVGSTVTVSWGANADAVEFQVYRDGESQGTTTNIYLTQTVDDGTYSYRVSAKDAAGNWSAQSAAKSITVDTEPPPTPVPPVEPPAVQGLQVTITWDAVPEAVNYEVFRRDLVAGPSRYGVGDPPSVGFTDEPTFTDTVPGPGTYGYSVSSSDEEGNWSPPSPEMTAQVSGEPTSPPTDEDDGGLGRAPAADISIGREPFTEERQIG